jgi:hypothetical protein
MNCQFCQQESDAYRSRKLSGDLKKQVEEHLKNCKDCAESYDIQSLSEEVINQEKSIKPDPDLTSIIMARLEIFEKPTINVMSSFTRIWKPALITASMAAAIFAGVLIGNIYTTSTRELSKPVEFALIDDVAIEAVNSLSNE